MGVGGSCRHLLDLRSSARLSLSLLVCLPVRVSDRGVLRRYAANERWFPSDGDNFSRSDDDLHSLGSSRPPAQSARSPSLPHSAHHSLTHTHSLSHSLICDSLGRALDAKQRPPGRPPGRPFTAAPAAQLCPLRPSSRRLIPYLEEAVPGSGAHRHAVLRHPQATDAVVVTREHTCKARRSCSSHRIDRSYKD